MEFNFDEDQLLLQETVRDFLNGECPVEFVRAQWKTETGRCPEFWSRLSEIGVPGLLVAEEFGGLGMNEIDAVRVFVEIGRAALAEPVVGADGCEAIKQQVFALEKLGNVADLMNLLIES